MNFVEKVLQTLKGGDEGKVKRFHKRAIKYLNDQIEVRKREIEDIEDKAIDLDDRESDATYNIDIESLKDLDSTKDYIENYVENIVEIQRERDSNSKEIDKKKKEIEYFDKIKNKLGGTQKEENK